MNAEKQYKKFSSNVAQLKKNRRLSFIDNRLEAIVQTKLISDIQNHEENATPIRYKSLLTNKIVNPLIQCSVTVTTNKDDISGEAGQSKTESKMQTNPSFYSDFVSQTPIEIHKGEPRTRFHCAEPNALSLLIENYSEQLGVTTILNEIEFNKTKVDKKDEELHWLSPCDVCSQWLEGETKFMLKEDFKSQNSVTSKEIDINFKKRFNGNRDTALNNAKLIIEKGIKAIIDSDHMVKEGEYIVSSGGKGKKFVELYKLTITSKKWEIGAFETLIKQKIAQL
ncbi:hypothetical protein [Parabacteroides sp.]